MKTVIVSLPYHFSVRNFVFTPVLQHMGAHPDIRFVLVSPRREDGEAIRAQGYSNVIHELSRPYADAPVYADFINQGLRGKFNRWLYYLWQRFDHKYLYDSLTYRFNYINDLAALHLRRAMSPAQQKLETSFSNFSPEWVGRPLTGSKLLFRLLFQLRYGRLVPSASPWITHLVAHYRPDVLVLSRLQLLPVLPFVVSARVHCIPIIGIVQSWDQPTSKGPIPPGSNVYVVGSTTMRANLQEYHGIPPEHVQVLGHTFLDNYRVSGFLDDRAAFMQSIGLSPERKLIALCTNLMTLKAHEPSIARHIATQIRQGAYGADCTLFIRTHPQDVAWQEDFHPLHDPPHVIVARASGFGYIPGDTVSDPWQDMRFLTNLMKHADVVINTGGTVSLDAIAFDTPVICLGFDGDRTPPKTDRIILRYEWEHLSPLVKAQGVWLVQSYAELDRAINAYLRDPTLHSRGRKIVRREHLEPFDGRASERLVSLMVRFAEGKLTPVESRGHWDHKGIAPG